MTNNGDIHNDIYIMIFTSKIKKNVTTGGTMDVAAMPAALKKILK